MSDNETTQMTPVTQTTTPLSVNAPIAQPTSAPTMNAMNENLHIIQASMEHDRARQQAERAAVGLLEGRITHREYEAFMATLPADVRIAVPKSPERLDRELREQLFIPTKAVENESLGWKERLKENKSMILVSVVFLLLITSITIGLFSTHGITGFSILNISQENNYTSNTNNLANTIPIITPTSSVSVSGTMYGEGTASIDYLTADNRTLHIATITSDPGTPRTSKPSYAPGDTITIEHEPIAPATYTAYLDNGNTNTPITLPLQAPNYNATILLIINNSGTINTYKLPIIIGDTQRTTEFASVCGDACTITPAMNGTINITISENATVHLSKVETANTQNNPPVPTTPIPTTTINDTTTINFSEHFGDPDGDTLYYSTSNTALATLTVHNDLLTIQPTTSGTDTITVYASDLKDIISAQFTLISVVAVSVPSLVNDTNSSNATTNTNTTIAGNMTSNMTIGLNNTNVTNTFINETNSTNITANITNSISGINTSSINSTNATLDCTNPDPNARPVACLYINTTDYFPDQEILLENRDRIVVARFTSIGNMLIRGGIVEHAAGQPGERDWRIGVVDRDGIEHATAWIDTTTGDLYLKGVLSEENTNLVPPPGSYSLSNRRSIFLAWADTTQGDLYVRGNVIPFRRTLISAEVRQ